MPRARNTEKSYDSVARPAITTDESAGLTAMPDTPLPWYTWQISKWIPPVAGAMGSAIIALYARRRRLILESQAEHAYRPSEDPRSREDEEPPS